MNLSKFGERLAELIFESNKTCKEVGEELGCGNSTISHYVTGRYLPTVDMLIRLADYFNCSADYLLGVKDTNYSADFKTCPPFCEQIINICQVNKISRYKLGKLTNISESVIRYWVQGKTRPSIYNVAKIAEVLDCSVDFVLGREK